MVRARVTGKSLAAEAFENDVTGVALAKLLGIHRSTLSAYHNGWRIPEEGWDAFAVKYRAAIKTLVRERAGAVRDARRRSVA